MNFKQVEFKTYCIVVLFSIISMFVNFLLIEFITDKNIEITSEVYYEQIVNNMRQTMNMLLESSKEMAKNEDIISILENNRSIEDIDQNDIDELFDEINIFEGVLNNVSFVDSIQVASIEGKYLYSDGKIYEDYDVYERFKNENLENEDNVVISEVHEDFLENQYVITSISLIYSEDGEAIGAVITHAYLERIIAYIEDLFEYGDLDILVHHRSADNHVHTKDGYLEVIEYDKLFTNNNFNITFKKDIFENGDEFEFVFDTVSIRNNAINLNTNKNMKDIVLISGMISAVLLIGFIKMINVPVERALKKLKTLLNELGGNKNNDYAVSSKFDEIEIISDSLGKSFDEKIKEFIFNDELTKLPNRKKIKIVCEELLNNQKPFALIFLDLNKFKHINDTYGHDIGDEVLKTFGRLVTEGLGNKATLFRYAGDEFIIVYDKYSGKEELISFYNANIKPRFENPIQITEKLKLSIDFSAGMASYPEHGATFEELIKKSDFMMYKNKQNHVSKEILIFEGDVYKESVYVDILKSELKKAVSRNEFILDYQPIVTTDKKITKAEALLRWNNPTLGFLLPDRFISYAEETKEIVNIGYWIIAKVCEDLQTLHAENIFIPISINVSPLQLVKDDFVDNVMDILKGYSIECKDLCFEITETVVLDDNETVARNLLRLKEVGIKVALDDFGTGYASFNYLKKYDLDIIKLDEIFIHDNNEEDLKIVKGVNDIAKTFGMDIVIEGVETEGQFNTLSDMGCNLIQGYYFSRPLSLEKFKNLVKENDKLEE